MKEYGMRPTEDMQNRDTAPLSEEELFSAIQRRAEDPELLFHGGIGMRVIAAQDGYAETEVTLEPRLGNPVGSIHGGLLLTLADNTGGIAVSSCGYYCTTSSCSFNFMRTDPKAGKIIARATVLKTGKRLCVTDIRIYDEKGTLFCAGLFEYAVLGVRQV